MLEALDSSQSSPGLCLWRLATEQGLSVKGQHCGDGNCESSPSRQSPLRSDCSVIGRTEDYSTGSGGYACGAIVNSGGVPLQELWAVRDCANARKAKVRNARLRLRFAGFLKAGSEGNVINLLTLHWVGGLMPESLRLHQRKHDADQLDGAVQRQGKGQSTEGEVGCCKDVLVHH